MQNIKAAEIKFDFGVHQIHRLITEGNKIYLEEPSNEVIGCVIKNVIDGKLLWKGESIDEPSLKLNKLVETVLSFYCGGVGIDVFNTYAIRGFFLQRPDTLILDICEDSVQRF